MINDHLAISSQGLQLLQEIETLRLKPYDDQTGEDITDWCPGATVGYGHLISAHEWRSLKNGIGRQRAVDLLYADLKPLEATIRQVINTPLTQQQFDALVLLAFNIGSPRFRTSSAVRLINDPRAVTSYVTLESAWKAWNRSQGKINDGVINRRDCEWKVWKHGVYERW